MTPAEFYAARLDELEAVGRPLAAPYVFFEDWAALSLGEIDYVKTLNPAYILADIAAKRAITALHASMEDRSWLSGGPNNWLYCTTCGTTDDFPVAWPCDTLKLLIQPFAAHPDFDESWKL